LGPMVDGLHSATTLRYVLYLIMSKDKSMLRSKK
jgi:hypothetical protein